MCGDFYRFVGLWIASGESMIRPRNDEKKAQIRVLWGFLWIRGFMDCHENPADFLAMTKRGESALCYYSSLRGARAKRVQRSNLFCFFVDSWIYGLPRKSCGFAGFVSESRKDESGWIRNVWGFLGIRGFVDCFGRIYDSSSQ